MNIKVCKQCHKFFSRIGDGDLCTSCQKEEYALLHIIQKNLDTNPQTTLEEISAQYHLSISKIKSYLQDNRLHLHPDSPIQLHCRQCHTLILSGIFCKSCKQSLRHALKRASESIQQAQLEEQSKKQGIKTKY